MAKKKTVTKPAVKKAAEPAAAPAKKKEAAPATDAQGRVFNGAEWIDADAEEKRSKDHHANNYYNGSEWVPIPKGFKWDLKKGLVED